MPQATLQFVNELRPIDGADAIEVAKVLGWNCVVKKGEFRPGDLGVYIEIDSLVPEIPAFEFMKATKYRVRTVKLRGQVSQGLFMPLTVLPETVDRAALCDGMDVSDLLGVTKYEKEVPAHLSGKVRSSTLPAFIQKTDETQIQNLGAILDKYQGTLTYESEKVDGSSETVFRYEPREDGQYGVCSRRQELDPSDLENAFVAVANKYDLATKLEAFNLKHGFSLGIQGELAGPSIQGNKYNLKERDIFVFNVWNLDTQQKLGYEELVSYSAELGLKTVPILAVNVPMLGSIDEYVEKSKGMSVLNPEARREGIVVRPMVPIVDPRYGEVSFKAVNPEFLLEHKE